MTAALIVLFDLAVFAFLAASCGLRVLQILRFDVEEGATKLIVSTSVGVVVLQILCFFCEFTRRPPLAFAAVLLVVAVFALSGCRDVWRLVASTTRRMMGRTKFEIALLFFIGAVLAIEFLSAVAPLTGSDALHYHFAVPSLVFRNGAHPDFFLSHSFFCGQGHALIAMGLAFGSEQLAMGTLFLGGALAAFSCYLLARVWMSSTWATLTALLFVLTPLVAWQTSAGVPDLWMVFLTAVAVLLISKARGNDCWRIAAVTGFLAGGIAGIKYTGCYAAAALAMAFWIEIQSWRRTAILVMAACSSGIWPFLRNAIWTGDPVFPFLLPKLDPAHVNAFTLNYYRLDTGAAAHHTVWQLLRYLAFAWIDPARVGFWQFFGPLICAFLPLLLLAVRRIPTIRVALMVWLATGIALGLSSGMTRFLIVVYPVALVAIVSGMHIAAGGRSKAVRIVIQASLAFFLVGSSAGLIAYTTPAVEATLGIVSRDAYLKANAPDFELAEFVNRSLGDEPQKLKTLIFFRHVYYLRIPFIYADPKSSWAVDPSKLGTAQDWKAFFHENSVGWVIRAPEFPESIRNGLDAAVKQGVLSLIASTQVENFRGKRSQGIRESISVDILRVNQ